MQTKMNKVGVVIRKCEGDDFEKVFPLFAQAYKFNPRMQERDYCDWQFRNTPFSEEDGYSLLVASHEGDVTGFLGYMPIEFRFAGQIHSGCHSYSWYSVGNNGAGLKLLTELMGRFDNIFYFGYSAQSRAIFKMFRMPLCDLSRWVAVLDQERVVNLFQLQDAHIRSQVGESHARINSLQPKGRVRLCQRFEDQEEFFFNEWKSIKGYIRRTGKYLNWRYVDIPRHNYQLIRDDSGGFGVFRIEQVKNHAEKVVHIVEWNFHGQAAQDAMALIVHTGRKENAIMADFINSAAEVGECLESLGFFGSSQPREPIPYFFRPMYHTRDYLLSIAIDLPPHRVERNFNFSEWYLTKGDSDMDRIKL